MRSMIDLIRALSPLRMGTVCEGLDRCVEILKQELPFTVHEFPSGQECNGWIVPQKWECQEATIRDEKGAVIYDGNAHPLGVASYSDPYDGPVLGGELKKHLFFSEKYDDALIYHCDWWYKPHARSWGFCGTKQLWDSIVDDQTYYVSLKTTFTPGTMKVCEYVLPATYDHRPSIVLNAHNCHPWCANDDLSGIAVGIEVMRRLQSIAERTYNYRLIVAPEHYGSIFYLQRFHLRTPNYALFLESLGTPGRLALQESFHGESSIDTALRNALRGHDHYEDDFRAIVGNDETCWDSVGYRIPCPSLSRVPFEEYHTSRDCPDLMCEDKLAEAADVVVDALLALDRNRSWQKQFTGLVCLSNPKFDLYKPYFDPSIPGRRTITDEQARWNRLMNLMPRYLEEGDTTLGMAERFGVRFADLHGYLMQWKAKGLIC